MKNLVLENYGMVEMNSTELVNIDGGELQSQLSDEVAGKFAEGVMKFFDSLGSSFSNAVKNCKC